MNNETRARLESARRNRYLAKSIVHHGRLMTRESWIRELALTHKLELHDEWAVKPMSRTQFNRASWAEQDAHDRKRKAAGKRPVPYAVHPETGGMFQLSKFEHELFVELTSAAPGGTEGPETQPTPMR